MAQAKQITMRGSLMNVFILEDDARALDELVLGIKAATKDATIEAFLNADEALKIADKNLPDILFLGIKSVNKSFIDIVKKFKKINKNINIIFVANNKDFAMDAISLHASGYLVRPIKEEDIKDQLKNLAYPIEPKEAFPYAKTFGNFELFLNDVPVSFSLSKSKEMLACLIDREGAGVTRKELAAKIFEDKDYDLKLQNYITKTYLALVSSLKKAGIKDLVIRSFNSYSINLKKIRCDAYDYLSGNPDAINLFHGEYMTNYSWAESSIDKFYK